jgi:Family of unknown function (DUF5995)
MTMTLDIRNGRRAQTISDVVAIMTALDQELPPNDGVRLFNHLYLEVTRSVGQAVTTAAFGDRAFLERLDVVFANLYFDAVAAGSADASKAPAAWRPLFECRNSAGILPLQFALAGMNAHINRDLPQGIVSAYLSTGGAPVVRDTRYHDFERVNDLLEAVESQIKAGYSTGIVALVDAAAGTMDDAVAMFNVRAAREAAWTNAEVLWTLRATPHLGANFFSKLDSFTGFAGRGMLKPVAISGRIAAIAGGA